MNEIKLVEILKISDDQRKYLTDLVINEISFEIFINAKRLLSISALPSNLMELSMGFIFSEGLVKSFDEIKGYKMDEQINAINFMLQIPDERLRYFNKTKEKTSGCGASLSSSLADNGKEDFGNIEIDIEKLRTLFHSFQKKSLLFFKTGGVHSAALITDDEIKYFAEDIGRHNAVDKVIGMALLDKYAMKNLTMLCSGRISSEIVKKAVRLNIPMIISQSATTSEAINLAWKYKLYVAGFARGNRMNIYTGYNKLKLT